MNVFTVTLGLLFLATILYLLPSGWWKFWSIKGTSQTAGGGAGTVATRLAPAEKKYKKGDITPEEARWLNKAPERIVASFAMSRAVKRTLILLVLATIGMWAGYQNVIPLDPHLKATLTASLAVPVIGILLTAIMSILAGFLKPGKEFILFLATIIAIWCLWYWGMIPLLWEIPRSDVFGVIPIPWLLVLFVPISITPYLIKVEKYAAAVVLWVLLLVSIWPAATAGA
ncbi:MAG: hypothetical protein ACREU9_02245 [Gammaproteobacteria bacterium]